MTWIVKIIVCLSLGPNMLEDLDIDSLHIFIFDLALIYPTFNHN
jgi:hypothetical protein